MMGRLVVNIINVKSRLDRREHILREFEGLEEFDPRIVHPVVHEHAPVSLWLTICQIVEAAQETELGYVIFCEDDHCFTNQYNKELLLHSIERARQVEADVLFGGVSWFSNAIQFDEQLFWVEKSSGLQFTIIFKRFYATILKTPFGEMNAADTVISGISERKYFIHPFISVQKEFGYSDITPRNSTPGRVVGLFNRSIAKSNAIKMLYEAYSKSENHPSHNHDDYKILTFAPQSFSRLPVFRIKTVDASAELTALQQCVKTAMKEKEELFVFINTHVTLANHFTKELLFDCIKQVHRQGGEMLLGAVNDFDFAVPVSNNLFWINSFISAPFIVFFKSCYQKILELRESADIPVVSSLSVKKFAAFPFFINEPETKEKFLSNEINYRLSRVSNKMPDERLSQVLEIVHLSTLQKKI